MSVVARSEAEPGNPSLENPNLENRESTEHLENRVS